MDVRRNLTPAAESDHTWLHQDAPISLPIPDHVLLCCFGPELAGARRQKQLSGALQQAGYRGALAQHFSGLGVRFPRGTPPLASGNVVRKIESPS